MNPPVDTQTLSRLQAAYVATFPDKLQRLEQSLEKEDWANVQRFGHQLKGSGRAYGFPRLTALGADIEEGAISRDRTALKGLYQELSAVMNSVSHERQEVSNAP
jgi:HPt (histidine-containing phosphotransfer) domain-containing protein